MSREPRDVSYWQYCQYALANASYNLYNVNNHIKVYFSIRQEALIDSSKLAPNLKRIIDAYIANLEYTKKDLKCMFDMCVKSNPPTVLYYKGNISCPNKMNAVAIIGTRELTEHGIEIARNLGSSFEEKHMLS